MGVSAKQTVTKKKHKSVTVTVTSETDVKLYKTKYPGYIMTRTNLGPNSIRLTFTRG